MIDKNGALEFLNDLETGRICIIEKRGDEFVLNVENKTKVNKIFGILDIQKNLGDIIYRDKIPLLENIDHFRIVPGAIVRRGVHIEQDVVVMPSFINIGAHVGTKTMIDSGVTIGSCVYVGARCHISSNVVLAGVLEPFGQMPVVVDDDVFIGAQSLVAEGVHIGKGAILAAGVHITSSTKIIDRATGKTYDYVPAYSVVVPGCYSCDTPHGTVFIQCAYIVKTVDESTRSKTSINDLLRQSGNGL